MGGMIKISSFAFVSAKRCSMSFAVLALKVRFTVLALGVLSDVGAHQ